MEQASDGLGLRFVGDPETFVRRYPHVIEVLEPLQADEIAYLQYTSGSTRFPRGVMMPETAASPGCPTTMTWA